MSAEENNRLIAIAFLVLGSLQLFGFFSFVVSYSTINEKLSTNREIEIPTEVAPVTVGNIETERQNRQKSVTQNSDFSSIFTFSLFISLVKGIILILAGFGLLKFAGWSRIFAIIASLIAIISGTAGILIGIYALWFLTSDNFVRLYSEIEQNENETPSIV